MEIANPIIQAEITLAFHHELTQRYGDALGPLYYEIVRYRPGQVLDLETLRKDLDTEAVPVLRAILHNQVEPPTLHAMRTLMIGCAIIGDRDALLRWAMAGWNRARQFGGDWLRTLPQWEAVANDPGRFILYAQQIKYFLMQI